MASSEFVYTDDIDRIDHGYISVQFQLVQPFTSLKYSNLFDCLYRKSIWH